MRYVDAAAHGGIHCICHIRNNPIGAVQRRVVERPRWLRIDGHSNAQRAAPYFAKISMI